MKTSVFPNKWKVAKAFPIFKAGDISCVSNYRQISLLCNFAKVLEIILYNRIYLATKNILAPCQHGFMSKKSTTTNLVSFTQTVSGIMDERGQVDSLYTDFTKAFDRIDHQLLLQKLSKFGFNLNLLDFFKSYLTDREQFVFYNGYKSSTYLATSGVPQGSNLGPLLFLLFIDDLCIELQCEGLIFADDLKIYKSIITENDCINLQNNLDIVSHWCVLNKVGINAAKCKVVTFTKKKNHIIYIYKINNTTLERANIIKWNLVLLNISTLRLKKQSKC